MSPGLAAFIPLRDASIVCTRAFVTQLLTTTAPHASKRRVRSVGRIWHFYGRTSAPEKQSIERGCPMNKLRFLLLPCLWFGTMICHAQSTQLDLPLQSQQAIVVQRLGVTDITINYHRPLANDRKVWGGLVPYGQVWRAGANENTTITFTDPVTIDGKPLDSRHVWSAHDPKRGSVDRHFFQNAHRLGELQLRREGRRSARHRKAAERPAFTMLSSMTLTSFSPTRRLSP